MIFCHVNIFSIKYYKRQRSYSCCLKCRWDVGGVDYLGGAQVVIRQTVFSFFSFIYVVLLVLLHWLVPPGVVYHIINRLYGSEYFEVGLSTFGRTITTSAAVLPWQLLPRFVIFLILEILLLLYQRIFQLMVWLAIVLVLPF